jgi:uncharacterized protein YlxW (UPF0749 family)
MTDQRAEQTREATPADPAAGTGTGAPAADPGSHGGPPDGRRRLRAALWHPTSRGQAVAAVLLAVLGFAAVTQVRSNNRDDSFVGARQSDLIQFINNLSLASQRAQGQITQLEKTRDALGNDTQARRTALRRARQQAQTLGILAGTLPAEGPGIRVTITDSGGGVGTNQLLNGLQELRDAGAEVIEVNDEVRVVAQTAMQDATGGGVVIDGKRLKAPYVVDAIGDPHTLATALDFTGGFVSDVEGVGGKVAIQRLDDVRISSVRTLAAPQYAHPGSSR